MIASTAHLVDHVLPEQPFHDVFAPNSKHRKHIVPKHEPREKTSDKPLEHIRTQEAVKPSQPRAPPLRAELPHAPNQDRFF